MLNVEHVEAPPVFYYDLGSPYCYLVAEQIGPALPVVAEWEPVLGPAVGDTARPPDRAEIERLAGEHGLQPVRWPQRWPPDTRVAALVASYAKQAGRTVAFSLAAFRQAFAGGRDLADLDTVLIAAAACEMHPTAVLKAIEMRTVSRALDRACARAQAAGVDALPAIQIGEQAFTGPGALRSAARALGARA